MKRFFIPPFFLCAAAAHAEILPTAQNGTAPALPVRDPSPNMFYLSAKGGFSPSVGKIDSDIAVYDFGGLISFAAGIDFNRDPNLRIELEIANAPHASAKFYNKFDRYLKAESAYTSMIFNVIPYFKLTKNINLNLIAGAGIIWLDYKFWDKSNGERVGDMYNTSLIMNAGAGLEVKLSERFSILPEFTYSLTLSNVNIPYYGSVQIDSEAFIISSFNIMMGIKYAF
jgi:opacity protein-like surface antigen